MPSESILSPQQREFLREFFARETGRRFFLTGGTALAEYYFHHRLSEDLDLFTTDDEAMTLARQEIRQLAASLGASITSILSTPTFQRFEVTQSDTAPVKLDRVRDVDVQFGQRREVQGVIVDSLENIGAGKIAAIFGRVESKDFVDLYFVLQANQSFETLLRYAKEKDAGLTEFWLAGMMRQVDRLDSLPTLLKPVALDTLKAFFLKLADDLLRKIKPPD